MVRHSSRPSSRGTLDSVNTPYTPTLNLLCAAIVLRNETREELSLDLHKREEKDFPSIKRVGGPFFSILYDIQLPPPPKRFHCFSSATLTLTSGEIVVRRGTSSTVFLYQCYDYYHHRQGHHSSARLLFRNVVDPGRKSNQRQKLEIISHSYIFKSSLIFNVSVSLQRPPSEIARWFPLALHLQRAH